jgi:probable addiction module antidote protein
MRDRDYNDIIAERYAEHPEEALEMLNAVLDDGEPGEMLVLLRQLTKAFGGVASVAEQAQLNPTQIYRTLSEEGNPSLSSLTAVLKAMKLRLAIVPEKDAAAELAKAG